MVPAALRKSADQDGGVTRQERRGKMRRREKKTREERRMRAQKVEAARETKAPCSEIRGREKKKEGGRGKKTERKQQQTEAKQFIFADTPH